MTDRPRKPWGAPRTEVQRSSWARLEEALCTDPHLIQRCPIHSEEPFLLVRMEVVNRIYPTRLYPMLAAMEAVAAVRAHAAVRADPANIKTIFTPQQEPVPEIRNVLALRIPRERIERIPTEEEEPSMMVRRVIAARISLDALDAAPDASWAGDPELAGIIVGRMMSQGLYGSPAEAGEAGVSESYEIRTLTREELRDVLGEMWADMENERGSDEPGGD